MRSSLLDELARFPGREEALQRVTRFHIFNPMFYRSNDAVHALRVYTITRFLLRSAKDQSIELDATFAEALALVHDDHEIITGDPQAGDKANMTPQQLAELKRDELAAIDELAERFPKTLGGYSYRALLLDVYERKSLECRLMQFADKFDGMCEALHELASGNLAFAHTVTTGYGEVPIAPVFYARYFRSYADLYPEFSFLTEGPNNVRLVDADALESKDWLAWASKRRPCTRNRLTFLTRIIPYDLWVSVLLNAKRELGIDFIPSLITKVE
ncbi:MAG: HD domain-containing protein [Patescibacteria group bacterium]|nr:HD domain-containing protein [Patescibacteria group bacterium]